MEASDEIKAADARPGPRAPMGDNRSHADGPAAVRLVESMTKFALLELSRRRVQRVGVSPQGILFVLAAAVQYPDA